MTERVIDLTLGLVPGLRTWWMKPPVTILPYMTAALSRLGFNTTLLMLEDHTGTHVDAPFHFYDGALRSPAGPSVEATPLERLVGRAILLDVTLLRRGPAVPIGRELVDAA